MIFRCNVLFCSLVLFGFLYSNNILIGQNLVHNGSFEDTIACPASYAQISAAEGWLDVSPISTGSWPGSPDYFHACNQGMVGVPNNYCSFQQANTGNAYAGIYTYSYNGSSTFSNAREFIGRSLNQKLIPNERYYISFYVNLCRYKSASNNFGVYFSMDTLRLKKTIDFAHFNYDSIITDTIDWTYISGSFVADSAYSFVSIGNFFSDSLTNYIQFDTLPSPSFYFIDDICVSSNPTDCSNFLEVPDNSSTSETILLRITDLTGREMDENSIFKNQILLYHYSDGSIRKKIQIE